MDKMLWILYRDKVPVLRRDWSWTRSWTHEDPKRSEAETAMFFWLC
uniref:Uncharacterized protein n=1 Tax=viral metagenome TaxID=1070528 RepID=A0A6C0ICX9_9ZZZZ